MPDTLKISLKYFPLLVGLLILFIGSLFIPWNEVTPYLAKLSTTTYVAIFVTGILYYLVRVIRYYYMLRVLDIPRTFLDTTIAYFVAQPAALIPGGEAYKTVTLKKHAQVQFDNGVSVVFLQSFTESIGLVLLALISSLWLHQYALIILAVMIVYVILLLLIRSHRFTKQKHTLINKLPLVSLTRQKIAVFINKNKTLLSGKSFILILLSGLVPSLLAALLLYIVAADIDVSLTFSEAIIALSIPGVLQSISFLPGGIGINEQSSVGILLLFGVSLPAAVALTIIVRIVTLGLGIILGLIAMVITKLSPRY